MLTHPTIVLWTRGVTIPLPRPCHGRALPIELRALSEEIILLFTSPLKMLYSVFVVNDCYSVFPRGLCNIFKHVGDILNPILCVVKTLRVLFQLFSQKFLSRMEYCEHLVVASKTSLDDI